LPTELAKRFDPKPVETRLYRAWLERGLFRAPEEGDAPRFSMVIPPPNVTGALHLGHALNNTLQDVLARHKRLLGFDVLWMPGTDHAGISTQVVVEKELAKRGQTRHDLGRERFVDQVWEWKAQYGARIVEQLQAIGVSCDWERERFTMDPGLSRAVREVFVRLHREGLIYRSEYLVSWCPRCTTVLSDLESPYKPVNGKLYKIQYALVDGSGAIEVETTRPETLLGDTAVAVHPDDERWSRFIGKNVRLPLLGREIPVVADSFVDREFGTGAVKVTPAHDPHDFECGRRLGLPAINILHPDGRLNDDAGPYANLDAADARKKVVADLDAQGLLRGVTDHAHEVPHCDRCDTLVQPLLSEQWFMRMTTLAEPALAAVREGRVRLHPKTWENTYYHWMENIRDWAISRQLWWGHRIPAWKCATCSEWTVAIEDPTKCEHCGSIEITQESDVLDTWFSSALWPFSTMGWPDDTTTLRRYYPTDVLSTAADILFFWVARMIMMGVHFTGALPFRDVYLHPLIRDDQGRKFSKSKGIGIDPMEVMEVYGTDAMRFTLTQLAVQGRDIRFGMQVMEGGRAFVTKLWNAARFALMNLADYDPNAAAGEPGLYDRWIRHRMDVAIADAHAALDGFRFNDAAQTLYHFVWGELCDWYIELAKLALQGDELPSKRAAQATLVAVLRGALIALHPIMPFVTDEIAASLPDADGRFLMQGRYPARGAGLDAESARDMDALVDVVSRIRQVRGELDLPQSTLVSVAFPTAAAAFVERHGAAIRALARTAPPACSDDPPSPTASVLLVQGWSIRVELDDPRFLADEMRRLDKDVQRIEKDLAVTAKKLENPSFVERARPEVVAAEREKHQKLAAEREAVSERLAKVRRASGDAA
jgi:valyl-tRNA synthetase